MEEKFDLSVWSESYVGQMFPAGRRFVRAPWNGGTDYDGRGLVIRSLRIHLFICGLSEGYCSRGGCPLMAYQQAAKQKWPHSFEQQPEVFKWILC